MQLYAQVVTGSLYEELFPTEHFTLHSRTLKSCSVRHGTYVYSHGQQGAYTVPQLVMVRWNSNLYIGELWVHHTHGFMNQKTLPYI